MDGRARSIGFGSAGWRLGDSEWLAILVEKSRGASGGSAPLDTHLPVAIRGCRSCGNGGGLQPGPRLAYVARGRSARCLALDQQVGRKSCPRSTFRGLCRRTCSATGGCRCLMRGSKNPALRTKNGTSRNKMGHPFSSLLVEHRRYRAPQRCLFAESLVYGRASHPMRNRCSIVSLSRCLGSMRVQRGQP